ncbi:MAG: hypothetical protein AB1564_09605 [Chloroflexota bacterium]
MKRAQLLLYLLLTILGAVLTRHYGESWDELKFYKYADSALEAYVTWPTTGEIPLTGNTYDNYGPAYVMLVALGARALQPLLGWSISDLRHLLYFVTFLAGVWAFHELAKRWLAHTAAFGATALFATQPLFWGHAFISPKDIPFLSFFLLSLLFGLRLFDSPGSLPLNGLAPRPKRTLLVLTALWLASVIGLFAATPLLHAWIESLVRAAAAGEDNLIARVASDIHTADPEIYIQKFFVLFIQARAALFLLSSFVIAIYYHKNRLLIPLLRILPSATLLGITICIRVLGPLAGLLITIYALRTRGKSSVPTLATYFLLALAAMYATWPYLWPNPIGHFIESIVVMAKYPWGGQVLFDGVEYASTEIPRAYLPVLLGIQLTEPVWVLFIAGLAAAAFGPRAKRDLLVTTLIWFVLPLVAFVALRSPLYDNFRQVFFILPPVFLLAGVVFEKIKRPVLQIVLIVLCALPGIVDGIRLHPYEYIYYNRFIGGVEGAFRRFELDYWGTSYREAADWLNAHAPAEANIWVTGPAHLLGMYLREDLKLYSSYEAERAERYDYVVSTSRYNLDLTTYPEADIVYEITRGGAILTVIKEP